MRADRLLSLVLLLRARGRMSASMLAVELEVSERTILRDIDALSTAGFPVYAERGRTGGFALLPGFSTDLTGLTVDEAKALLAGSASELLGLAAEFASAMRKVAVAMPDAHREVASSVADRVIVRSDGWRPAEFTPDVHLAAVQRAVFAGKRLRIEYHQPGREPALRTIDPLGLVFASGRWYLLALRDGENRTYRLSRMTSVVELDEPARRSDTVDIARLWDSRRDQFHTTIERLEVEVRVAPSRRSEVDSTALVVSSVATTDGLVMTLVMGGELHVMAMMWALGDDGELLGPPGLRSALRVRAQRLADRHGG